MKVCIYGTGKRFHNYIRKDKGFLNYMKERGDEIVYLCDGLENELGSREIWLGNRSYLVYNKESINWNLVELTIITPKMAYKEISEELERMGVDRVLPLESYFCMMMFDKCNIPDIGNSYGIEIGGPSNIFRFIYDSCKGCDGVNYSEATVWGTMKGEYIVNGKSLGECFTLEATKMNTIQAGIYDFLLSSNVLEHTANPLAATREFCRIVKKQGIIIIAVPNKKYCFDHNREYTTFDHIMEDYKKNMDEDDLSHLDEIIEKHDYELDPDCGGKEQFVERAKKNCINRCLHHHVFSFDVLKKMMEHSEIDMIETFQLGGNLVVVGKHR